MLLRHRFTRPLGSGDFGDLAADLFGIDSGAQIGLEYRFGIVPNGQIGVHRTSDRTTEFFAEYGVIRQGPRRPLEIVAIASIDGPNNFKDTKSPALGAIISRWVGDVAAFYVEPIWVNNTNPLPKEVVDHNDTYTGWEVVENAAVALADGVDLILAPGRLCQNGKPVPSRQADFQKFARDMRKAGLAVLQAAHTRNQEKVSDATDDLADACSSCHEVYRDKGPAHSPARCTPPVHK